MITKIVSFISNLGNTDIKAHQIKKEEGYPQFMSYIRGDQKMNSKKYPKGSHIITNALFIDSH